MIDEETYKEIKGLHKQSHTFRYITMFLEIEDDELVKQVLRSKDYAEFTEKSLQVL